MIVATKFRSPRDEGKYDKNISKKIRENCKIERSYYDITNANFESNGTYYVEHPELTAKLNEAMDKQRTERQAASKAERDTGIALANAITGMKAGFSNQNTDPVKTDNSAEMELLRKENAELKAQTVQSTEPPKDEVKEKRPRRSPAEMEEARKSESKSKKS